MFREFVKRNFKKKAKPAKICPKKLKKGCFQVVEGV